MRARERFGAFLAAGLLVAAVLAFGVSRYASAEPDGLDRVAIDQGFDVHEQPHALAGLPTAGYAVRGVDDEGLSTGLAGLIGVAVTFTATGLLFLLVRRTGHAPRPSPI